LKKSSRRVLSRLLTVLLVVVGIWFAWEWRQQDTKQVKGVQTVNPQHELHARCLEKAKADYDRDVLDSRASPAPNLALIAAETYELEKTVCQDLYGN
jgi:hypothetical protein